MVSCKGIFWMSAEIFLRDFRSTDLDGMFQLDEACFAEEFRFDWESMREFVAEPGAIVLIAESPQGELAGFVVTHVESWPAGKRGYVVTLDVASESRRRGIAGLLMEEMERRVAFAGAVQVELHVFAENEGAIRFYEGRGYRRAGARPGFYGSGLDARVYRKDLK
jgi:[ribosomal protein S18]-alanine N-acetyltransferase